MRNIKYIIFIFIFFLVSLVPFLGMTFYKTDGTSEGRVLAEFPKIISEGKLNLDFGEDLEDYFGDHFAFRAELVDACAFIKLKIFNTSTSEKVITGKDGWLFYAETLEDFSGTNNLKDEEISRLSRIIALESDYCRKNGKGYVFTIAPNKNTIYPEMMADYYVKTSQKINLDNVNAALENLGVNVCNLKKNLLDYKSSTKNQLYYTYDSHWNLLGASVGYKALLDAINEECGYDYVDSDWISLNFDSCEREGDLLKMIRPLHSYAPESYAQESLTAKYKVQGMMKSLDDLRIITKAEGITDNTKLLMYRDSFGRALIEPLSNTFSEATYLRANPFAIYDYIDENTVVIREIVERNIRTLMDYAPVVVAYSPISNIEGLTKVNCRLKTMKTEEHGDLIHYYGIYEGDNIPLDYIVIIKTTDGMDYEAFPIVENEIKEENVLGYSFYLPSTVNMDSFEVVFYENKGD